MTEDEWLAATDPRPMLEFLRGKASDRKCRLFLVACARHAWSSIADEECRKGIEVAEQHSEGFATDESLRTAGAGIYDQFIRVHGRWLNNHLAPSDRPGDYTSLVDVLPWGLSVCVTSLSKPGFDGLLGRNAWVAFGSQLTASIQPLILREIVGNPFRPVAPDPAWRTSTVLALAKGIYDEKHFDRLPILHDALLDAGCDSDDILSHVRSDGPHCRGCWVLDLVLGKE